ncbi:hypothetical protein Fot_07599 [Forsythia ovata]|uniref:Uncharacterized protein n=1 Tax=Forsythia ovata TaxID=205694 RepID=A0ABD1WW92_9LAMI
MVKSKGQSVNIELEIGINSKKSKRKTFTSFNRTKRSKNSVQEDFEELENVRNGCCNLNEVVMYRIAKIELKQSEIEAKQAEILSFQRDLKSQLNDLSGNVQNMIADFLNQMDKKFHSNTEEVVLNRQIDEFEKNDFNNYTEFETDVQVENNDGSQLKDFEVESQVQDEDNDGSQLKDFEVESQVQYDRKGKGKAIFWDKTKNESGHHGATEFEKIEQDDDIIQIYDITPSAPRRMTRKIAAVYRSPYISEFVSS